MSLVGIVTVLLALGAPDASSRPAVKYVPAKKPVPNRFVVVLEDEYVAAHGMKALADQVEGRRPGAIRRRWASALGGFALEADRDFAQTLANEPWVKWVEEDQVFRAAGTQTGATWGLDRLDQRDFPLNGSFTYAVTGSDVNVYVIDTGIYAAHPYFEGRVFGAYTAIFDEWGTDDGNGHGTFVAGIVASNLFGAAKGARVYSVRVLDVDGAGYTSDIIDGINWVREHHVSPAVVNLSFNGDESFTLDWTIATSTLSGITFVAAAGNDDGADACSFSPSGATPALTVGASTSTDAVASFSNLGSCVDLFAPGSYVTSTCVPGRVMACPNGLYTTGYGTSFAAPFAAAIAAQYLAMYPSALPSTVMSAIASNASAGKLTGVPSGTNNRLLFSPSECTAPQSACGYSCKNLSTDRSNCGACGHGCGSGIKCFDESGWYYAGTSCVNGSCVSNPCW